MDFKYSWHHKWDTTSWCPRNSCESRYSLLLLAVSDYKRSNTGLYFIITNFHTEHKPQVKTSHDMNSPEITAAGINRKTSDFGMIYRVNILFLVVSFSTWLRNMLHTERSVVLKICLNSKTAVCCWRIRFSRYLRFQRGSEHGHSKTLNRLRKVKSWSPTKYQVTLTSYINTNKIHYNMLRCVN